MARSPRYLARFGQRRLARIGAGLFAFAILVVVVVVLTSTSASGPDGDLAQVGDAGSTTTAGAPPIESTGAATVEAAPSIVDEPETDGESVPANPEYLDGEPDHLRPSLIDDEAIVDVDGAAAIGLPTTTTTSTRPPTSVGNGNGGAPSPTTTVAGPPPSEPPPPAGSTTALGLAAANTGVVGGQNSGACADSLRELSGAITIDDAWLDAENGGSRTVENFDVSGNVVVATDDVTLRCGRVVGGAGYSIENKATGLTLEWIEANQTSDGKTILGGNFTAYRCNVYGGEDSIHVNTGSVTITECYIHDQNYIGGDPHPDAIQATSGGSVQRLTVVRSKLISFYKAPNAALQINVANSWSITDSYLWGGVYSILGDAGNPGTVTNNYFGWDSSQSGAIGDVDTTRSGNVWWEWLSPKCSGSHSASSCVTPSDHPGNGTPI